MNDHVLLKNREGFIKNWDILNINTNNKSLILN